MKTTLLNIALVLTLGLAACQEDNSIPTLPSTLDATLPQGTALDRDLLFGVWSGSPVADGTAADRFTQTFQVDFSTVEDAEAIVSHWYTDGGSESADSVVNLSYTYSCTDTQIILKPGTVAAARGASRLIGVYQGNATLDLYTGSDEGVSRVARLTRIGNPSPVVTAVDYTLPSAGDRVTITGRNLQFVDHVYFPVINAAGEDAEVEAADFVPGSKQITVTVPEGQFRRGSLRLAASTSVGDCYTAPYMFATDCIYSAGVTLFGDDPVAVPVATGTDDKLGYLRITSSGESLQTALDRCGGAYARYTPTTQLAIQMDLYVETDGEPVWRSGYISYRLNKDQNSLTSSMVANVALWDRETPCLFTDGWKTLTIPLTTFSAAATADLTLGSFIQQLKSANLQTILTFVNYPLDTLHPAVAMTAFRMQIANIRLVPTE
jgi:hypothetical protein